MATRKHRLPSTVMGATTAAQAARNCLEVLRTYSNHDGSFDHTGFLNEMDARSLEAHGRKLTKTEQRTLAQLVATYQKRRGA